MRAIVIEKTRVRELDLPDEGSILAALQEAVGGYIEALPVPPRFGGDEATAYINEEGKYTCEPNMAATDFMVPGVGIFPTDYIAGPMVLLGYDPETGENADVPAVTRRRAMKIAREAFGGMS